ATPARSAPVARSGAGSRRGPRDLGQFWEQRSLTWTHPCVTSIRTHIHDILPKQFWADGDSLEVACNFRPRWLSARSCLIVPSRTARLLVELSRSTWQAATKGQAEAGIDGRLSAGFRIHW